MNRSLISTVIIWTIVLFSLIQRPASLEAGVFNSTLNVGDTAPAWKDLPGVDDKKHSYADLKDREVVVVIFTCNSCPVATDYEDRLCEFAKEFSAPDSKVGVVAINVNKIKEDQLPAMKQRAESKKFPFPYLYDETQKIAKDFGAVFTPEVYVLNRERKILYMGAIDNHSDPEIASKHYLQDAVKAALAGKEPSETEVVPIGCRIRYARERRK